MQARTPAPQWAKQPGGRAARIFVRPIGKRSASSNNQRIDRPVELSPPRRGGPIPPHPTPFSAVAPSCSGGRCFLTRRYQYATATIILLVCLRLVIGWHFFKEGVSHYTDPNFSSEGFLKQAKGPLADQFKSVLPDFHGWDRLMLAPLPDDPVSDAQASEASAPAPTDSRTADAATAKPDDNKTADSKSADEKTTDAKSSELKTAAAKSEKKLTEKPAYEDWLRVAIVDWRGDVEKNSDYYHFDDKQKAAADTLVDDSIRRIKDGPGGLVVEEPDIHLYRQLLARVQRLSAAPGATVIPNEVARVAAADQNPLAERGLNGPSSPIATQPAAWLANAQGYDQLFHNRLHDLLTADQKAMVSPLASSRIHDIDTAVTWMLLIAGGCLIVGLFTRLAAVVGALFLLSIICTQPPWLATSVQTYTYNQWVEMIALLALATTPVGRWGGLDYFLPRFFGGCCRANSTSCATANPPSQISAPPVVK